MTARRDVFQCAVEPFALYLTLVSGVRAFVSSPPIFCMVVSPSQFCIGSYRELPPSSSSILSFETRFARQWDGVARRPVGAYSQEVAAIVVSILDIVTAILDGWVVLGREMLLVGGPECLRSPRY
ncbi:hypothetical protein DFH09DRAFT_1155906 [Mycena vulgaris]|nr:hypothetical protein DFH09DRAFT_1155906 [Mycena vulgaris]